MNRKGFFCCLISIYLINFVAGDPIKRSSWDLIPCYTCSNNECDVVPSATTSCTSCVTVYNECKSIATTKNYNTKQNVTFFYLEIIFNYRFGLETWLLRR